MRRLLLARHGETEGSGGPRRFVGQLDLALSDVGRAQAEALGRRLAREGVALIYCSDLSRSLESAGAAARLSGAELRVVPALREIDLGEWEGLGFDEVASRYPAEYAARGRDLVGYRVPGGESFGDCAARVFATLDGLLASAPGDVAIVGHAGPNRLVLCRALGLPLAGIFRLSQDHARLSSITMRADGPRLDYLNCPL